MSNRSYLKPYQDSVKEHGSSFGVTLWANPYTQERRFEVFTQMCFFPGKRVLDAGCSRGDLAVFLARQNVVVDHYIGIDALSDVIDYARARDLPQCEFHCGDFVTQPNLFQIGNPQIICISGSLNTMTDQQVEAVLSAAWSAASEALVFNFLSDRAGPAAPTQTGPARRLNTLGLVDWAMSQTSEIALRQDYLKDGHDATILMRKPFKRELRK